MAARSPRLRLWKAVVIIAVVAASLYLYVVGDGGWLDLQARRERLARLESEVARLEAVNDSLRIVLDRMANDPEFVEKVAREQYGMVRPGERLYRIRRPESADDE